MYMACFHFLRYILRGRYGNIRMWRAIGARVAVAGMLPVKGVARAGIFRLRAIFFFRSSPEINPISKCADPTTSTFLPFALETCGAFGADAYGLLKALARRKAADSPASALELGGVDGLETQTSRWLQHFVQSVSVQLQRAQGSTGGLPWACHQAPGACPGHGSVSSVLTAEDVTLSSRTHTHSTHARSIFFVRGFRLNFDAPPY